MGNKSTKRQFKTVVVKQPPKKLDVKVLVLGASMTGKSTLFMRFRLPNITNDNRSTYQVNILSFIRSFIDDLTQLPDYSTLDSGTQNNVKSFLAIPGDCWTQPHIDTLKQLKDDKAFVSMMAYNKSSSIRGCLSTNVIAVMESVCSQSADSYVVSDKELYNLRIRTTGIIELSYEMDDAKYSVFDVGGTRNERSKWIHCFDKYIHGVFFCVSLVGYLHNLYEDDTIKDFNESCDLFQAIVSSRFFSHTTFVLVMTKLDIFEKEIQNRPEKFKDFFPDYQGSMNAYDCGVHMVNVMCSKLENRGVIHVLFASLTEENPNLIPHLLRQIPSTNKQTTEEDYKSPTTIRPFMFPKRSSTLISDLKKLSQEQYSQINMKNDFICSLRDKGPLECVTDTKKLTDCLKTLFDSKEKDFTIISGKESIKCHKAILMCRSSFFEGAILSKEIGSNSDEDENSSITVADDPSIVEIFIQFAYLDCIPPNLDLDALFNIFKFADKYCVDSLQSLVIYDVFNRPLDHHHIERMHEWLEYGLLTCNSVGITLISAWFISQESQLVREFFKNKKDTASAKHLVSMYPNLLDDKGKKKAK